MLPGGTELLRADFSRDGFDLILDHPDHGTLVLPDYFLKLKPPALETADGAVIKASVARALAGPMAPQQNAQLSIEGVDTGIPQTDGIMGEPIGSVSEAEGAVTVRHPDGSESMLVQGDSIYQGDVLETGKDGAVSVVFVDDTVFSLDNDGRMVMDEMVYDPDTQTGSFNAEVVQGVFSFVSGQVAKTSPDGMVVNTPTATIGIRGSTVLGEAGGEGNQNNVTLVPDIDGNVGEVFLTNGAGSQVLNQPGASVTMFSANTAPPPPVIMSSAEIQQNFGSSLTRLVKTVSNQAQQKAQQASQRAEEASAAKENAEAAKAEAEAAKAEADQALAEAEASGDPEAIAEAAAAAAQAEAEAAAAAAAAEEAAAIEAEAQAQAEQAQAFSSLASTAATAQEAAFVQVTGQDGQQGNTGEQDGQGPGTGPDGEGRGQVEGPITDDAPPPPPPPQDTLPDEILPQDLLPVEEFLPPPPPPPVFAPEPEPQPEPEPDPVNLAPSGNLTAKTLLEDGSFTGNLSNSVTDPEGRSLTFTLNGSPAKGHLALQPNGQFTYTPDADANGADKFSFKVTDGANEVTFVQNLNITPTPDAPVVTMSETSEGKFAMEAGQDLSAYDIKDMTALDFDGDGDQDLLFTRHNGTDYDLMLGTNDGTGTLSIAGTGITTSSYAFDVGDVNNDGREDIVFAESSATASPVYFQNADGTFTQTSQQFNSTYAYRVELGDMDGDGLLDIVAARTSNGAQYNQIFFNGLNGVAGEFESATTLSAINDTKSLAVGDFDNDNDLDIVFGNWGGPVEVHLNDGTGVMTNVENLSISSGATLGITIGDFNGDGYDDIFAANRYVGNMVFLNDGDGTFTDTGQVLGVTSHEHIDPQVGDLDGDGDLDVFTENWGGAAQVYLNDGNGNFTEAGLGIGATNYGASTEMADFDGDGDLDLVSGHSSGSSQIYNNTTVNYNETMTQGGSFVFNAGSASHLSASDPDGLSNTFTYTVTGIPAGGAVKLNGTTLAVNDTFSQADLDAGNVQYVHAGGADTEDSFSFTVSDGSDTSTDQTFNIKVDANTAPVFTDPGTIALNEDGSASGTFAATDADGDAMTWSVVSGQEPTNGSLTLNSDGTYTYTPDPDYEGSDSAQIQIDDGINTTTATVNFSVTGVNDAPSVTVSLEAAPSASPSGAAGLGFDGVNDYVEVSETNYNNLTTGTVEAWVYVENFDTSNTIIAKQHDFANTMGVFSIGGTDSSSATSSTQGALVWHGNNTGGNFESTGTINAGQWQHVAIAFNDTGATFYINGAAAGTVTGSSGSFSIPDDTASTTTIGNLIASGDPSDQTLAFDGWIADLRVWNTERTATDIANNYSSTLTGSETGLIGYWPLDSITNGTTADNNISTGDDGVLGDATVGDLSEPSDTANANMSITTNTTTVLTSSHLSASDIDLADAGTDFIYTLSTIPTHGELQLNGTALAVGQTFLQSDINGGNVTYVQAGLASGPDQFQFTVSDGTAASSTQEFTVAVSNDYTNFQVISGETWNFDGTGTEPTSTITNDGTINMTAGYLATPTITNNAGGVFNFSSSGGMSGTLTNYGTLNAQTGANILTGLVNYGTIHIDAGVNFLASWQTVPVFDVNSVLEGDGTFRTGTNANLPYTYNAIVNPGTDGTIGTFTFNTDGSRTMHFSSTAQINIDIAGTGTAGTNYDQLVTINSSASALDGTINLTSISGYIPTSGDTFSDIMTYYTGSYGSFDIVHDFGAGWVVAADYGTTSLSLTVLSTADAITGTTGNDTLMSLASNDTITGDTGTDVLHMNGAIADYTWQFLDASTLQLVDTVGTDGTDTVTGVESVRFHTDQTVTVGSNTLAFDGNDSAVTMGAAATGVSLDGGAGTDSLTLADGGNTVTVSNFETISGGTGADDVTLGSASYTTVDGVETVTGSSGNDTVQVSDGALTSFDGGAGSDTLSFTTAGVGNTVTVSNVETVSGNTGVDNVTMGTTGSISINNVDTLTGSAGNDTVTINTNSAATTVYAGLGDDTITGSATADVLNGEGGADTFVYTSTAFNSGDLTAGMGDTTDATAGDRFDFSTGVESSLLIGNFLASDLILGSTDATLSSSLSLTDTIALVDDGTNYSLEIDFDYDQVSDFSIGLGANTSITSATFDSATGEIVLS